MVAQPASPPPPPPPPPPQGAGGGGWTRSRSDRLLGGVAGGIARRLEIDALLVRIGFVVLTAAGGLGALAYLVLWAVLPEDATDTPSDEPGPRVTLPRPAVPLSPRRLVALGLMALGGLLLVRRLGLWLGDGLVWPIVLVAAGSAIVWARGAGETPRQARRDGDGAPLADVISAPASPLRIASGTLLALAGIAGFLAANVTLSAVRDLALALVASTVGLGLLLAPWLWRLATQLTAERRERIRQEERAELAAHLHDSVLQTLALIQRASDQPRRMVALARRQERELRAWLHSAGPARRPDATLATAAAALGEEVETTHGVEVEVVVVGDADLDPRLDALLGATREACVNAAKHAGVDRTDVYIEVEDEQVVAFVRDRGRGFDSASVAEDRRGIRDSIVGRLTRHGGSAEIVSRPGEGTEVELSVPRAAASTLVRTGRP